MEGHRIFLFKGDTYYEYKGGSFKQSKFRISGKIADKFEGVPNDIDSAFSLDPSQIYFTKGDKSGGKVIVYRVSRQQKNSKYTQDEDFPKNLDEEFNFTPPNETSTPPIDGVFYKSDENTAFIFSGVNYYSVTDDGGDDDRIEKELIRDQWLSC